MRPARWFLVILSPSILGACDHGTGQLRIRFTDPTASAPSYDKTCEQLSATQRCTVDAASMSVGLRGLYLVSCTDGQNKEMICSPAATARKIEHTLLEVSGVNAPDPLGPSLATVDQKAGDSPRILTPIQGSFRAGGLQLVTAYLDSRIPNKEFVPNSMSATYFRICTDSAGGSHCGHGDARRGDILWDSSQEGARTWGFLSVSPGDGEISELGARSTPYPYAIPGYVQGSEGSALHWDEQGNYAPTVPFDAIRSFTDEADFEMHVYFDMTEAFGWIDNLQASPQQVTAIPDKGTSADAYHPLDDLYFAFGVFRKDHATVEEVR